MQLDAIKKINNEYLSEIEQLRLVITEKNNDIMLYKEKYNNQYNEFSDYK
jgi:hypothetical protein